MTAIGKLSSMNFSGYVGCVTTFSRVLATYCMLVSSRIWIRCRFISGWLVIIHTHLYYLPLSLSLSLVIAVVVVVILAFFLLQSRGGATVLLCFLYKVVDCSHSMLANVTIIVVRFIEYLAPFCSSYNVLTLWWLWTSLRAGSIVSG